MRVIHMLSSLTVALALGAANAASAANLPPGFDATRWQGLVDRAAQKGERMPAGDGVYKVLEHIVPPDRKQPRQAEYFSAVGLEDGNGKFFPFEISAVSESWQLTAEGNWKIDQWFFLAQLDGELYDIRHAELVETSDGTVLDGRSFPTAGASDPESQALWSDKLSQWFGTEGVAPASASP